MSKDVELARRLKQARKKAGLLGKDAAQRLGVSPQAVSIWEREGSGGSPSEENLEAAAALYGVELNWLRFGVPDRFRTQAAIEALTAPLPVGETSPSLPEVNWGAIAQHFNGSLRLWEMSLGGIRVMREDLQHYEGRELGEGELLRAYRELAAREWLILGLTMDLVRNGKTDDESVRHLGMVSTLNQVVFEIGLRSAPERPVLPINEPHEWERILGLTPMKGLRTVLQPTRFDGVQFRDKANRLVAFFDRRILTASPAIEKKPERSSKNRAELSAEEAP